MEFSQVDPNLQSILLGVVSNGLYSLIIQLGKGLFVRKKSTQASLGSILEAAIDQAVEDIEWQGPPRIEEVCLFLESPEVEEIVRQIYAAGYLGDTNDFDLIKEEFIVLFSGWTDLEGSELEDASGLLFALLQDTCERALGAAIDEGILAAHEAKSAARYRMVMDTLLNVQENLDFLTSRQRPTSREEIIEFAEAYRKQVAERHGYVDPPFLEGSRKIPIDDIYVAPNFTIIDGRQAEEPKDVTTSEFLGSVHRVVVLGDPGGGKSTFAFKLCYDLAVHCDDRLFAGRQATPIFVMLRDYGVVKKEHQCSVLQYIEMKASSWYQLEPLAGAFEYL